MPLAQGLSQGWYQGGRLHLSPGSTRSGYSKLPSGCWLDLVPSRLLDWRLEFLATRDSKQGNSQHGHWLSSEWVSKRVREGSHRGNAQSLCTLIPEVTFYYLSCMLVFRIQLLGPAHTWGEGSIQHMDTRGLGSLGHVRGCPWQTGKPGNCDFLSPVFSQIAETKILDILSSLGSLS